MILLNEPMKAIGHPAMAEAVKVVKKTANFYNNITYESFSVYWDQYESWTGDWSGFPKSREFSTKEKAIEFANYLNNDDDPNIEKDTIEVKRHYREYCDSKLKTEDIKWK